MVDRWSLACCLHLQRSSQNRISGACSGGDERVGVWFDTLYFFARLMPFPPSFPLLPLASRSCLQPPEAIACLAMCAFRGLALASALITVASELRSNDPDHPNTDVAHPTDAARVCPAATNSMSLAASSGGLLAGCARFRACTPRKHTHACRRVREGSYNIVAGVRCCAPPSGKKGAPQDGPRAPREGLAESAFRAARMRFQSRASRTRRN